MTSISAGIAAQQAMTRQTIALEMVKQSHEADQAIVNMLDQAVQAGSRGGNVNITA